MSISRTTPGPVRQDDVTVWDPLIRVGHWLLVIAFATSYLSGEEEAGGPDQLHVISGYVLGAVLIVRIVWGFVGSEHARFRDFVYGPVGSARYLFNLARGRSRRYLGHSPAGGLMVLALLACLTGTVATGLVAYGELGHGPLAGMVATRPPAAPPNGHNAGSPEGAGSPESAGGEAESLAAELHGTLANVTLGLIVLHLLGVAGASLAHRENLVAAMIHGRKRRDRDGH